ncbi:MAG: FAD-dependent oxidoreductase [Bryobacterales bacterium]|nr:FAD-dependent oxidoreductase [Bryobacterales bacterium]
MDRRDFAKSLALGSAAASATVSMPAAAGQIPAAPAARDFDMVVYGGTAGGVATAVAAARHGLKTLLLEPRDHLGGMVTGGLSRTDIGRREVLGGMALEFYARVGMRYNIKRYNNRVAWFHEPHVGESVFKEMLHEAGVTVLFRHPLREKTGVEKSGGRIRSITTINGARFAGRAFADCSYEGDLMAQAAVTYTFGREPVSMYGESLAGVRDRTPYHQFMVDIPARDASGNPASGTRPEPVANRQGDQESRLTTSASSLQTILRSCVPWPTA